MIKEKIKQILKEYDAYTALVEEVDRVIEDLNEELSKMNSGYTVIRYSDVIYLTYMQGDLPVNQRDITNIVLDNMNNITSLKCELFR